MVLDYWTIFATDASEVTPALGYAYTIEMAEDKVIKEAPSKLSPLKRESLHKEVKKLLAAGVLERSTSQYNLGGLLSRNQEVA